MGGRMMNDDVERICKQAVLAKLRYESVSKYVKNGSTTAVMDVIGSLCVSLGSSTVQLHDSLGQVADAHSHVQRLV
jgi:hypothetical protein